MKRVLHLLNRMSPGGVESLLMNLYNNIDRDKLQFDFYVCQEGTYDDEIKKMGGNIYYTEPLRSCGIIKYLSNWDNFLKEHKEIEIIHCHLNNVGLLMLKIAKKNGIKVRMCHSHASETLGNPIMKIFRPFFNHIAVRNSTIMLGCSDKANQWLYGKHSKDALLLNNGVDTKKFEFNPSMREKIRNELNISDSTVVIGHVGRLVEVKNHSFLIDIFEKYHQQNPDSLLLIIGDGNMKERIKQRIEEKNMEESIWMLGLKTNVMDYFQAMDCFIFPSFNEGLPVTLIEAQASGLPVLASQNISDMSKVIDTFEFLDINDEPEKWVSKISVCNDREKYAKEVEKAGYDIKLSAIQYMKLLKVID